MITKELVVFNTMKELEPKTEIKRAFLKATMDWYEYVGKDHHKDRDCHWDITKKYSYGYDYYPHQKNWYCEHLGYIAHDTPLFTGADEEEVMMKVTNYINNYIRENPYGTDNA